ncbi:MAG: hypothetical protein ACOCXP_03175 [Candidatus Dojkabacteria bacterium]
MSAKAILHLDFEQILLEHVGEQNYRLPRISVNLGENPVDLLKYELETEYLLKARFQKTLPDAWISLLDMHTGNSKQFATYYIFELLEYDKRIGANWFDKAKLETVKLHENEEAALDYFFDQKDQV